MDPVSPQTNQSVNESQQKTKTSTQDPYLNGSSARYTDGDNANRSKSNDVKRKKSKNTSSASANNAYTGANMKNYNLDEWLESSFRNSFSNFNADGYVPPNVSGGNSHGNKPFVPDQMHSRYLKYMMPSTQPYQHPSTSSTPFGRPTFNNHSDFASLPPVVNLNNLNQRSDSNELLDGMEQRRFSDPCLAGNSDNDSPNSEENSQKHTSTKGDNSKLFKTLLEQIHILHETNSKICRNLHENMVDIQALKHAPSWGLRHRRESLSGLSTHSQPMGYFGTNSPAPTYHSGMYTPGMMTDVVREVKEAARVREDALLSRVRAIVDERSWSTDVNMKLCRDLEEMKIQFNVMRAERNETNARMLKMEDEIKSLRSALSHVLNSGSRQNVAYPHHSPSFNERDFSHSSVRSGERHTRRYLNIDHPVSANENDILSPLNPLPHDSRSAEKLQYVPGYLENVHLNGHANGGAYCVPESEANDSDIMQMEKETLKLRQELQDMKDSKQKADSKIQDLEHTVKSLQNKMSQGDTVPKTFDHGPSTANSRKSTENGSQSQGKLQTLSHIQTKSPKMLTTSSITVTGPVTDL
ncbi:uncharacterized protein LOC119070455 isoform X1 [Bradysia coprophila]|uniref:uncharacterized protein LOC119070455 isoform X1 n=1 Tax=Bradysia coprophila TaxID=38358 RepID=UPI00187D7C8C|nr:uncharacterized protein LOC119070455 isoform X1 [Bradysia coprophila]